MRLRLESCWVALLHPPKRLLPVHILQLSFLTAGHGGFEAADFFIGAIGAGLLAAPFVRVEGNGTVLNSPAGGSNLTGLRGGCGAARRGAFDWRKGWVGGGGLPLHGNHVGSVPHPGV